MSRSYYVIELSARWLTILLVALALVMVLAFALGYGAAWSVLSDQISAPVEPTTALQAAVVETEIPEVVIPTEVPEREAPPTSTPRPEPTATWTPEPTQPPTPTATSTPAASDFFVQVLASSQTAPIAQARSKLETLGFSSDYQHLMTVDTNNTTLYKLRIGPFPDRRSADRVAQRMSAAGFPDSWVVAP